jgi:hypothetical protein
LRVAIIADSARKHGIGDEDMTHAVRNVILTEEQDDGRTMFIGPARDATLLEVGVMDGEDGPVIIHAMVARRKYLAMVANRKHLPRKGDR